MNLPSSFIVFVERRMRGERSCRSKRARGSRREDKMALEQLSEPFLTNEENNGEYCHHQCNGDKGHPWLAYIATFVAVCGSYQIGAWTGYTSDTESAIMEELNLTTAEYSLFGSILTFGSMMGAITSGITADFIGRKWAMGVYSSFCIVGWLSIHFAQSASALDIGRVAGGYGIGAFTYVVPIYVAEIAPSNRRGTLTSLHPLMICAAISISFLAGLVLSWRALALTGLIPCGVMLLGLLFIPESPRWLAKRGEEKEFQDALQKLRGRAIGISSEAEEIQNYTEELPKTSLRELFQRKYRRSLIVGIGLMLFQQIGGLSGVSFYLSSVFESAGFSSTIGTIIFAVLQIPFSVLGATLMDRTGRKPLILISATGLVAGCVLLAISFYLEGHDLATSAAPALAVAGILVYAAFFCIGMAAVPPVVMAEVFPINIKGIAGSLATLANSSGGWLIAYSFNFLMEWSSCGTFTLFAVVNAMIVFFVAKVVPETKGKTLEQIEASINA